MKLITKIFLLLVIFSFYNCKENKSIETKSEIQNNVISKDTINEKSDITNKDIRDDENSLSVDNNFVVVEHGAENGFYENIYFKNNFDTKMGAVLILSFYLKNNTGEKIRSFEFSRYIKAVYKNGEFEYFPQDIADYNKNEDFERFDNRLSRMILIDNNKFWKPLESNEIWEPNQTKYFKLIIQHSGIAEGHIYGFRDKIFERTPKDLYFTYQYKAKSIDNEYENIQAFSILDAWKEYQTKIGLR